MFLTQNDQIKLGDLGCARTIDSNNVNLTNKVGTKMYLSPEMIKEDSSYNFNSDIWYLV